MWERGGGLAMGLGVEAWMVDDGSLMMGCGFAVVGEVQGECEICVCAGMW